MKKRAMKKWIPKNTSYCNNCKWRHYLTTIKVDESNCEYQETCKHKPCWSNSSNSCNVVVHKCDFLNFIDWHQESLLWDGCKECGVKD